MDIVTLVLARKYADSISSGTPGVDGSIWYAGEGVPDAELGVVGDYYLDTSTGDVYFHDGSWAVLTNITGPAGAPGTFDPVLTEDIDFHGFAAEHPLLQSYTEKLVVHEAISGTHALDVAEGNVHSLSLQGATTLTFTLPPHNANQAVSFSLLLLQPSAHSITWPETVWWRGGTPPAFQEMPEAEVWLLTFFSWNGGITWLGMDGGGFYAGE